MSVKLSIIISVLDSHEVVRRQILHFRKMNLPEEVEIIIVDDYSTPAIKADVCCNNLNIIRTEDKRSWSQPCARNFGAKRAEGTTLLMTDIDHVLSKVAVNAALEFDGDKMMFRRQWAVLDESGDIKQDKSILKEYGLADQLYQKGLNAGSHYNTFCIRRDIFNLLGGYDERFCGKYGGDDTDFSDRYGKLYKQGKCSRHVVGPDIFVFPNPQLDVMGIFHKLRQNKTKGGR